MRPLSSHRHRHREGIATGRLARFIVMIAGVLLSLALEVRAETIVVASRGTGDRVRATAPATIDTTSIEALIGPPSTRFT